MSRTKPTPTSEILLQHVGWIRNLAHQLVADADLADDLAQDALVVALERPPRDGGSLRAWLARVMRNRLHERLRSDHGRADRERRGARPEGLPPTDELVGRLQTERRIADLLTELDEPYRTTVLLRFYEGLPPREIARKQGVPIATVKSRLQRGLARLRAQLDRSYGDDRRAWITALLPLAKRIDPLAATTLGGIALNAKLLTTVGVVAAAATVAVLSRPGPSTSAGDPVASAPAASPAASSSRHGAAPAPGAPQEPRRAVPPAAKASTPPSPESPEPAALFTIGGRVLNEEGQPLAGLAMRVVGDRRDPVESVNGGWFSFQTEDERGEVTVEGDAWVAVRQGVWNAGSSLNPIVIVAPSIDLSGRVVDERGSPVAGARVAVRLPEDFDTRFTDVLDSSLVRDWSTVTGPNGAFELERVPAVFGSVLRAAHAEYRPGLVAAPTRTEAGLEVLLTAVNVADASSLRGRVVRADGAPATSARVALGVASVRVDGEGRFALDPTRALTSERVTAVEAGSLPAALERPAAGWPDFLELRLGGASLSISGRLLDHEGRPRAGALIWIDDPTPFGVVGTHPLRTEGLLAGGPVPPRAVDSMAELPEQDGDGWFGSATPVDAPNALWYYVETDADGRFELPGLLEREYTLNAVGSALDFGMQSEPIRAGTRGVELRLPELDVHAELNGRVVTRHGHGVAGVRVTQWLGVVDATERVFGGHSNVTRFLLGPSTLTDDEGRFLFQDIQRRHVSFYLISDEILPAYGSVDDIRDPGDFELEVIARAHLQVELDRPTDRADEFAVTDADGGPLAIHLMRADGHSNLAGTELVDGRSSVVTVNSEAAYLTLFKNGEVVDTLPLVLRPGEVHQVRY